MDKNFTYFGILLLIFLLLGCGQSSQNNNSSPTTEPTPESAPEPDFSSSPTKIPQSNSNFDPNSSLDPRELFIPIKEKDLLPHDGLFVRRNNQFGTRLNVGIQDLIEQGVIFNQNNIRFDDFISLDSKSVLSPKSGESLAVSYGITPIPPSQKRDERATHYLEIALKTSDKAPQGHKKSEAPPVNYIFVIDTSGSMSGEKLDDVKISIRELFKTLKKNDVIGIIEFNDKPTTVLKATPVEQLNDNKLSEIMRNVTAGGGTDINIGISFGIDELDRFKDQNTLNHIYLFSDGNPTSGVTDWIQIRQNVDRKTKGIVNLSTFAVGSDANLRELDALAGLTGGKSTSVDEPSDIQFSLQDDLSRREHLAAINIQLKVDINEEIPIVYLYGHDQIIDPVSRAAVLRDVERSRQQAEEEFGVPAPLDLVTEEEGIRIFVPNLAVDETYYIVFELSIPENVTSIGEAKVQYLDTFKRENQIAPLTLSSPGNLPSNLVIEHALGLWTSEVVFYVLDDLYQNDLETAKQRINNHAVLLDSANNNLQSESVKDDVITLRKLSSLSENLGLAASTSDGSVVSPQRGQTYFMHSLNQFGRVRNGFNRGSFASTSAPNP